jgi:hypothetical protein
MPASSTIFTFRRRSGAIRALVEEWWSTAAISVGTTHIVRRIPNILRRVRLSYRASSRCSISKPGIRARQERYTVAGSEEWSPTIARAASTGSAAGSTRR